MCAIVGWQLPPGAKLAPGTLEAMSGTMSHRGPDDTGSYADDRAGVALAHRRLSIIDLSEASHQPMIDASREIAMVYNGEIYNFRALRAELEALGHAFRSTGDTEVVLRSYLEWGSECFTRFAGMFALAIWDGATRTLHLARDAMGMKPLYFRTDSGHFIFASELKAFTALPGFDPELDAQSVQQYLEFGYAFDERRTMLRGVEKLAAGWRLEVRDGHVAHRERWYSPPAPDPQDTRDEAARLEELGALLDQVVQEHLIADVPLGLLLSGGLDSSLIASVAARKGELLTVTMGFGGSTIDERENAREVSRFIGSRHTDVLITAADVKAEVAQGAWVFDDLFADWGTITTRLLYRRCREQGLKVVLVGEGADELFGGYDIFDVPRKLGPWQQFRLYQKYAGRRHGRLFGEFREIMSGYIDAAHGDTFGAVRLFESRRQLPNQYVMKVDKASMAESVEARAPYLDRRIADLAYRTPREWLQRGGQNKYMLRALARTKGLLPATASNRPKFGAPLATTWMDDDAAFRRFAMERILADSSQTRRLGLARPMRAYFERGVMGDPFPAPLSIFRGLAWRLLLLELWAPHYLTRKAS